MLSERLVDDLRNGQAVEIGLASDGLDPAALDMEGDALRSKHGQSNLYTSAEIIDCTLYALSR